MLLAISQVEDDFDEAEPVGPAAGQAEAGAEAPLVKHCADTYAPSTRRAHRLRTVRILCARATRTSRLRASRGT